MLTERGLRRWSLCLFFTFLQLFEHGNSLLPEYSRSDWALTCAWLFASVLLDMLLD